MAAVQDFEPQTEDRPTRREIKVYMHSPFLYWWPVWAVGFVMAGWTYLEDRHMALVPPGTVAEGNLLVAPAGAAPILTPVHMSASRVPGMTFALTVLAVTAFGGAWMRGWKAYTFAAMAAALLFLIGWADAWDELARWASYLQVHVNLGGYLVLSTGLFLLWLWQFLVPDRRTYVVFSMSQVRVHNEIGEQEHVYDAGGVSFEKEPYDWFRRLVGFGAGDLRVQVRGHVIEIPNVVHVGRRQDALERMLRTKDVA